MYRAKALTSCSGAQAVCDSEGGAMRTSGELYRSDFAVPIAATEGVSWFAIHTRFRHEKVVLQRLCGDGLTSFLPIVRESHRWRDRRQIVDVPLFPSYVFVRLVMTQQERARILRVDGVQSVVGNRGEGTPIPDDQIETVRTLLSTGVTWGPYPFLKFGQRVRIRGGALEGLEGIFLQQNGQSKLVLSLNVIQRSMLCASRDTTSSQSRSSRNQP
jgi:transcriptional antiterminator NusG